MWAVSPTSIRPCLFLIPRPTNTKPPLAVAASATSDRQQPRASPIREQKQPKQDEGVQSRQLKGLDVLWAMQKAAAKKNKLSGGGSLGGGRNKKRSGVSAAGSDRKEDDVDYSNVRPLCIKEDWGVRLCELEKRLQELSQTK